MPPPRESDVSPFRLSTRTDNNFRTKAVVTLQALARGYIARKIKLNASNLVMDNSEPPLPQRISPEIVLSPASSPRNEAAAKVSINPLEAGGLDADASCCFGFLGMVFRRRPVGGSTHSFSWGSRIKTRVQSLTITSSSACWIRRRFAD